MPCRQRERVGKKSIPKKIRDKLCVAAKGWMQGRAASPLLLLIDGFIFNGIRELTSFGCGLAFLFPLLSLCSKNFMFQSIVCFVSYNERQRLAAKKRGALRSTFLSARDKDSHEERTLRNPPQADRSMFSQVLLQAVLF